MVMTERKNKYNATKVRHDNITFDSKFEHETYELIKACGVKDIKVHYPIIVLPENNCFRDISWKVDFYLPEIDLYVESKGYCTQYFDLKMQLVSHHRPYVWERLVFVANQNQPNFVGNKPSITLPRLKLMLMEKMSYAKNNIRNVY